jgi:hypothetical protein
MLRSSLFARFTAHGYREKEFAMKKAVTFVLFGTLVALVIAYVVTLIGFRADCIRAEAGMKAQSERSANDYDASWKKFREVTQIDESHASGLKSLYDGSVQSRTPEAGTKAMFRFIKEHNPRLETATYAKLQADIDAARASFVAERQRLIDQKRAYETLLGSNRAFAVNMWLGYPHVELDKYDVITSATPPVAGKAQ